MPAEHVEVQVPVYGLADMIPETFSGENDSQDTDTFVQRWIDWAKLHTKRFPNDIDKVQSIRLVLSGTALHWYNNLVQREGLRAEADPHILPQTMDAMKDLFTTKFRINKTHSQLRSEIASLKYEAGKPCLSLVNRFQYLASKLNWDLATQINKFVRLLPQAVKQFVVTRPLTSFTEILHSLDLYQDMIEVATIDTVFKNVSFEENECVICGKSHLSSECSQLKLLVEKEVKNMVDTGNFQSRSSSPEQQMGRQRSRSKSPYQNSRARSISPRWRSNNQRSSSNNYRGQGQPYYNNQGYGRPRYFGNNNRGFRGRQNNYGYNARGYYDYNTMRGSYRNNNRGIFRGNRGFNNVYRGRRPQPHYAGNSYMAYHAGQVASTPIHPPLNNISSFTTADGSRYDKVNSSLTVDPMHNQNF